RRAARRLSAPPATCPFRATTTQMARQTWRSTVRRPESGASFRPDGVADAGGLLLGLDRRRAGAGRLRRRPQDRRRGLSCVGRRVVRAVVVERLLDQQSVSDRFLQRGTGAG